MFASRACGGLGFPIWESVICILMCVFMYIYVHQLYWVDLGFRDMYIYVLGSGRRLEEAGQVAETATCHFLSNY